jgi:hypothetical protein
VIKILQMNNDFRPLGKAIPKPAPAAPQSREIKPGIWQAPDGKLRTDFATGQSVAPAQKAAPATPLPVVPNALGDGWIEWRPGMDLPTARVDIRLTDCVGYVCEHDYVSAQAYPEAVFTWPKDSLYMRCTAFRLIP